MAIARASQIHLDSTRYYHCISRCVRRAFLCGRDSCTNQSFDHRKRWLVDRMKTLSEVFSIRVCAYSIMSNHFHVVLYVDIEQTTALTDAQVVRRWAKIYKHPLANKCKEGQSLSSSEQATLAVLVPVWRERLMDISWYMRSLNEYIARKANREDRCKGRFWEGRFKSQALLDEGALLTCMAYVDLNPVRAGVATTLESSEFTSIQERIDACQKGEVGVDALMDFLPTEYSSELRVTEYLPFKLTEYLELVDWAGRSVRTDKNGAISERAPPILTRVGLYDEKWLKTVCSFESTFHRVIGAVDKINRLAIALGRQWMQGLSAALNLYV